MTTTIYQPFDKAQDALNPTEVEREAAYQYALYALDLLDLPNPGLGDDLTRRLWRADGEPILTLDEFVRAAMEGELMTCPARVEWLGEM